MGSMSYCVFENTSSDFERCLDKLEEMINTDSKPLSESEMRAAKRLASQALRMVQALTEVSPAFDGNTTVQDCDEDELEAVIDILQKQCGEEG